MKRWALGTVAAGFLVAAGWQAAAWAAATRVVEVRFGPGAVSATLSDFVKDFDTIDFTLDASVGQRMSVDIQPDLNGTFFDVIEPDEQTTVFTGSVEGDAWVGKLNQTGTYTIHVYLARALAKQKAKSRFDITFKVTGKPVVVTPTVDDPDYWAVTGVSQSDELVLRSGPGTKFSRVGAVPYNATGLKNLSCQDVNGSHWCQIEAHRPTFVGWANTRFLESDD